ncbi:MULTISPECIES: translocation/assembly module TamB domain-containing protein [unclassified Tenacibaculum]|uniref:translocation/assembly module TamB domain-containing protein n=1 Tax=unclassified Tenacibaculum TaxID=2635139 RepID=UPI001F45DB00|nr:MULTISPECIES: translocation/assembly module TamB [unclassified Tenacibaculum]MCF2876275.1 translocation/assembly module TamB domain-containing protein [Tenacibaculum sp. Cn5-1]MCF2936350.1 translocation/assembly module TamB domain-containing protein [Tenacibaculum sp. Cn5-34]MCG7511693.1 translocation/assembly module TamB domain-containing protein [Tenacibaculum sp. Cn5-46]
MAKHATDWLNKEYNTDIVVKRVDLSWLGSVQLKGIEIRDHHKDTLIFVQNLSTSLLNAKRIIENNVNLGEASLSGAYFNMRTYKGEKNDNLSIFIDSFEDGKPRDSLSKPFVLNSDKIALRNLTFKLYDDNKKDPLEFAAYNAGGDLLNFSIVGPDVSLNIREMNFTENRGVNISNLSTDFVYTKKYMQFDNTVLETDNKSKIEGDIKLTYNRKDFANFNDKVNVKAKFSKSALAVKDLSKLYKELSGNDIVYFTGDIDGTLNNFSANNVRLHSKKGMRIVGNMGFVNAIKTSRGFVFDADLDNVTSNYYQLKSVLPNLLGRTLPTEFQRLGNFTLKGILSVTPEQMDATLTVNSEIGTTISDLLLTNIDNIDEATYVGEVEFQDFDLGIFANDPVLGKISLKADVSGSGFNVDNINTTLIGKVSSLVFNEYEYKDLIVNGQFQNKKFDGLLKAEDDNFKLKFEGLADFSSAINKFDFVASIDKIDLKKTNLFTRDSIATLTGNVGLNISGNTFDDIIGKATFRNLIYTNQKQSYSFKRFEINSSVKDSIKTIEVDSEDIVKGKLKGKFSFGELIPITQNALGSVYTNYRPHEVTPNQFLDFDFTIYNKIIDVFLPQISIGTNTRLKGKINSDKNALKLTFSSPEIEAYKNVIENIVLRLDNKNPLYNTHLTAGKINTQYYNIEKLNLLNRTQNDTLFFKSVFKGGKEYKESFNLDFYYTIDELQKSVVGIQKSTFNYKGFDWIINPKNNQENKVAFDLKENNFNISPFVFSSGGQKIEFKGIVRDSTYKDLQVNFEKVKLASFLPPVDSLKLNGDLNGIINYKQENNLLAPKGNLLIENFHINDYSQGDLALNVTGDNSYKKYDVNLSLISEKAKNISAVGGVDFSKEKPIIDLSVFLKEYEIAAFSPLGEDVLNKLRGKVTGDFTAKGPLRNPDLQGVLNFEEAGLKFPYLNVDFDLKGNTSVVLDKNQFKLNNIVLEDTKHQTQGTLSGSIAHQNFKDWFLDLKIDTDNLLVLDTEEEEEVQYYGTGFLDGDASISGLTSNLFIQVNGKTNKGTKFVIPLSDVKTIDNYKLIRFKTGKPEDEEENKKIKDIKGLELKIDLTVTKEAVAQVVIDKVSGSELRGSGEGNLEIEINTLGKFNMFGNFTVDNGLYNFKYAGISKPFTVQKGGTISWEGDPYNAELDLTAIYRTKANPAQLLDNINSNRKIPIDLYTKITGGLFNSKQEFDIKIPNANSTVASELEFVLNGNDLNTKMQHFSFLLAFGTFYNQDAIGDSAASGLTGTASEIATNILTNMLNSKGSKFQLGLGYTQGDRGNVDNLRSDDQVDVSISTQLSDRVLVNGKVGVPVGANTQTSVVGEVKVEVLLNEEGNLRGNVFNRQNEVQYSTEEEGYTQGVGISYQVNFNNLSELGEKLGLKKKKKKKEVKKDTILAPKKNKLIRFKSKKKKEE